MDISGFKIGFRLLRVSLAEFKLKYKFEKTIRLSIMKNHHFVIVINIV